MALRGRACGYAVALALVCVLAPTAVAQAATITVDTELDFPSAGPTQCSLRSALVAAGLDTPRDGCPAGTPGHDTIVVPAGLYGLNGALLVGSDVTIVGAGPTATIISQGATDRVIWVLLDSPGNDVTLDGLTVTGGHAPDGADGLDRSKPAAQPGTDGEGILADGGMQGESGGGVYNPGPGTLTLLNARVTGNSAGNGGDGGNGTGGNGGFAVGSGLAGVGGVGIGGPGGWGGGGGGIYSAGPVIVRDSTLTGNLSGNGGAAGQGAGGWGGGSGAASQQGRHGGLGQGGVGGFGGEGGAIYGLGTVTVERSVISANRSGAGGAGGPGLGGVGGSGGSTAGTGGAGGSATGGDGGGGGYGGAVRANGTLTIASSTISGNATGSGGIAGGARGGVGGAGNLQNGNGWFGGDATAGAGGQGGDGAGTYAAAALSVRGTLFFDNHTGNGGHGGFGEGGAGGIGGFSNGHGNTGGTGTGGAGGRGGRGGAAVTTTAGSLVVNTTMTQNGGGSGGAAGDGLGGQGGNSPSNAQQGGFGGIGNGGTGGSAGAGGLAVQVGDLGVVHATISSNAAGSAGGGGTGTAGQGGTGSSSGGAGTSSNGTPGAGATGGLHNVAGTMSLANSIVASNTPSNCAGTIAGGGHDIRFGDATCPGSTADPKLSPLGDNGGATRTQALFDGSPALDAVPASGAGCTTTDQRGVSRPRGPACDAGAYERAAPDVTTGGASAISDTGATVAGSLTPNAGSASYRFEYGATAAYGSSTATQSLGGGVAPAGVTAALSGLAPATTYHYRLVATTPDGTAAGEDRTFTTAATPRDSTPPRFLAASLRPSVFAVNRRGAREKPVAAVKRGTTFRFRLSEDARVVFTIARVRPGRRVGGRCVKPNARNRSHRRCKRYVKVGRFAMSAKAGANTKRFSGRIGRKTLAPAPYRATLVARDAAGNASAPRRLSFRVVRP